MSKMRLELGQERRTFARQAAIQMQQRRRKRQEGAKHRFTDERKEQAVKMRAEGMSLSATVRVMGASVLTVSEWVKKGGIGERASDAVSGVADKRQAG